MAIPLVLLGFGSIFIGYLLKDLIIGVGSITFSNSIFIHPTNLYLIESEFIPIYLKLIPVIFSILGVIVCLILNYYFSSALYALKMTKIGKFFFFFFTKK
jgi:NADH-ubiquinone oxidoreductase chain 5